MNRQQKIEFLKALADGTRSLGELMPHRVEFWHHENDVYVNAETKAILTEEQFKLKRQGKPKGGSLHLVLFENYSKTTSS